MSRICSVIRASFISRCSCLKDMASPDPRGVPHSGGAAEIQPLENPPWRELDFDARRLAVSQVSVVDHQQLGLSTTVIHSHSEWGADREGGGGPLLARGPERTPA